jgi:hypothetical protein
VAVTPADFSASEELMERAERSTREWLANGNLAVPGLSRTLGAHHHGPGGHDQARPLAPERAGGLTLVR